MRVLTACEESGAVRDAFSRAGHEAMSCDIKPSNSPGLHYHGDVFDLDLSSFDLVIAFPPCTFLSRARLWECAVSPARARARDEACSFVRRLWDSCPRICIENPPGYLSSGFRPYSQLVYPWFFGDPYRKEFCLWLKDVPPLIATCYNTVRKPIANHVNGRMSQDLKSEIKSSWSYYPGTVQAMVDQWSHLV